MPSAVELLEECLASFRKGDLSEDQLRAVEARLRQSDPIQDLLYLQTVTTSMESKVIGMTMLREGKIDDGPADYESWPYKTVAAAITDGVAGDTVPRRGSGKTFAGQPRHLRIYSGKIR